jgi:hypothetical protein
MCIVYPRLHSSALTGSEAYDNVLPLVAARVTSAPITNLRLPVER